ncbi:hypothetical protein BURPS1106B_A2052 [Burkholderia pseudomallei 1106b]|uniref:Uncharacterized protein n=1 Tax=Burkholderia pseudomallei (strain 1106a) TaxID=357348 RepID=A3NXK8_BURP0|nr:hypothetical protein BURPS1106A_2832 [Burkholderia pseudomallei 1106a]AFR16725.1 hypothetical protein BPC006_I2870 [Burkholderia pseudomallei BPC006]EES26802.1 hypothetical protein BURPS1106B_A2052 [Burkholderia pseudomallei 1106b]
MLQDKRGPPGRPIAPALTGLAGSNPLAPLAVEQRSGKFSRSG